MAPTYPTTRKCSVCGRMVDQEDIRVKKVLFREIGRDGRTVKSRTTEWLCAIPQEDGSDSCLSQDPDYSKPMYSASPGMNSMEPISGG